MTTKKEEYVSARKTRENEHKNQEEIMMSAVETERQTLDIIEDGNTVHAHAVSLNVRWKS